MVRFLTTHGHNAFSHVDMSLLAALAGTNAGDSMRKISLSCGSCGP